jgi:hypothetical protein
MTLYDKFMARERELYTRRCFDGRITLHDESVGTGNLHCYAGITQHLAKRTDEELA